MTVFVDTSAIVALLSARDTRHEEAVVTWKALLRRRVLLVTTDLVLAETVVLCRARAGYEVSVRAGDQLLGPSFDRVWADRPLIESAWRLYRKHRDHDLSLCDCVSFALMHDRGIDTAFAYDGDFTILGFAQAKAD